MSKVSVFDKGWIDLVFEGRNKSYGAYQLRQENPRTTLIALFSGIALVLLLVSIPVIINIFKPAPIVVDNEPVLPPIEDFGVIPVTMPEKPKPIVKATAAAPAPKPKEDTKKLITPVATDKPTDDNIAKTDDFKDSNPGSEDTKGTGGGIDIGETSPKGPDESTGTGTKDTDDKSIGTFIVAALDEAPEFPGGIDNFLKQVSKKYNVPDLNRVTTIKVYVSFVVEKDGSITNVRVPNDPGNGLGAEAIRVLNSIKTKWKPGKMKGNPVRTSYTLPIVIRVR
jgi:periplasmic protein TonB